MSLLSNRWFIAVLLGACRLAAGADGEPVLQISIQGLPLGHWVEEATRDSGPGDLGRTVGALTAAVRHENPKVKVAAADALAVLGPRGKGALPALLEQYSHEFPWVRVSCQAATGSMGKDAVPALIDKFENSEGGPRNRAAFVLGGMGSVAKPAVPTILKVMELSTPKVQARYAGILRQIDPERFDKTTSAGGQADLGSEARLTWAEDGGWSQFHGPLRDSICRERGLLKEWPADGPRLLWQAQGLGRGYSTVSIANGVLYTMGDRVTNGQESQFTIAYDLNARKQLWATEVGPAHTDGGPRCTPTVDEGQVFVLGTDGDLVCLGARDGKVRWRRHLASDFGGQFMSVWKFSESPLVDGDRLICTPGGSSATLVALNKATGKEIWRCQVPELGDQGADGAGYSSAVVADIHGVRQYIQLIGRGIVGVEATTGRFLWGYNRIANNVANITTPAVRDNYVFASTSYNTGSVLLEIKKNDADLVAEEVYFTRPRDFQNHHGGVILLGDHVFGGHGQNRGDPACLELATGKVVWKERAPARGSASVVYADGNLIYRYDRGDVVLVEANESGLRIRGQFKPPEGEGPAWAHPVVHQGRLYLRHADLLMCYDLRAF